MIMKSVIEVLATQLEESQTVLNHYSYYLHYKNYAKKSKKGTNISYFY